MTFKLGSIPVKVEPRFFLMSLLLGLSERDPAKLAIWIAVIFASVLVHEMGHALMGMVFGFRPAIVLHGMGGHTTFGNGRWTASTVKSVLISLAGPFAGFLFAGVVVAAQAFGGFHPTQPLARLALLFLLQVNIAWGIFNLVPMLPLDGGNVMSSILKAFSVSRGEMIARVISIVLAAAMGLYAIKGGQWWLLYLAALFGFQNFQAVRGAGDVAHGGTTPRGATPRGATPPRSDAPASDVVEESYGALNRGDTKQAIALLGPVLFGRGVEPEVRRAGLEVYVVALIKEQRWSDAVHALERERNLIGKDDLGRYATMLRKAGRAAEADVVDALRTRPALDEFRA